MFSEPCDVFDHFKEDKKPMKIKNWCDLDAKNEKYRAYGDTDWVAVDTLECDHVSGIFLPNCDKPEVIVGFLKLFGFDVELEKPITLTEKEWHFARAFDEGWIARGENTRLCFYKREPEKLFKEWGPLYPCWAIPHEMFPFIEWTDTEPWSIEELRKLKMEETK